MIRSLTGTVTHYTDTAIILSVHGVGYLVYVANPTSYPLESEATVHTYLSVRETALDLYGFANLDELQLFEILLTLPKIGPKSAASILANAELSLLKTAVAQNDATQLSKLSGIGKKTAEKIVAGLQEKLDVLGLDESGLTHTPLPTQSFQSDAIDALISLGYPHADARTAVQNLPPEINNANDAIRSALQSLGQG